MEGSDFLAGKMIQEGFSEEVALKVPGGQQQQRQDAGRHSRGKLEVGS